ncbi:MAG: MATE family efflux transporter [Bacteroidales bacterium]|jgi:MATE family multidrug resistance protein|nr:MATE family efflux transporter [Bacteroidales bacterium]
MKNIDRKINGKILGLALPSILANITVPLAGIVDLAIAGRLGDASLIGGIAISTMLFDLLYWNMGFLRMGTGGMVAQSYGRHDLGNVMKVFTQGMTTAGIFTFLVLALQYVYVDVAFMVVKCSPQVEKLARIYYFIRIWAAPATISLYVFKGFFIGMQNAISPMIVEVVITAVNMASSYFLAVRTSLGFAGIAWGTVIAQYSGLLLSGCLFMRYRKLFKYIKFRASVRLSELGNFISVNSDLLVRSVCFLGIYAGFTSYSAHYGDTLLAVSTIIMKVMMFYSYFIDGFAYAGEALSGRYFGEGNKSYLQRTVRIIFLWCTGIAIVSFISYFAGGKDLIKLMTDNETVIDASLPFLPWLWVMPVLSVVCFTWDGIFVGVTATAAIRNCMIAAVIAFFITYHSLKGIWGMNALFLAYMVHLFVRSLYMTLSAKKCIFGKLTFNKHI